MNRLLFLLIVFAGMSSSIFSQSANLNDYSYIIVPAKFDFLHEEDQFQINSMTKFFLEKNGFNALFNSEVPDNVRRCDGLWVDVIKSSGIVYTKLEVVIKDCKENELYRSQQGKSKFKHYQKAYQDALRKAFKSFQSLNVSQPKMIVYKEEGVKDLPVLREEENNEINEIARKEIIAVPESKNYKGNLPQGSYSTYINNDSFYLLRKKKTGYAFYEESEKGDLLLIGTFSLKENVLTYIRIDGSSHDAAIDELGNISVYTDGNQLLYRKTDQ